MKELYFLLVLIVPFLFFSCADSPGQDDYARFSQAVGLYYDGDMEGSLLILDDLYRSFPVFRENTKMYARVLYQAGRKAEAAALWESLLKKGSVDLDMTKHLCAFYLEDKEYDKASELLEQGLNLSSEDPFLLYLTARVKLAAGETDSALSYLLSALSLMEKQIVIPLELARIYSSYGMSSEAADLLVRYSSYLPDDHSLKSAIENLTHTVSGIKE